MIHFRDVGYSYVPGGDKALDAVSITIEAGERVAVAGASGSGKSTLLKLMNGLATPSVGTVLVAGVDTSDDSGVWDVRRRVGLIFQNPDNQLVSTTVERELAFGLENLGLPPEEIRTRVEDVSRDLSIRPLLDRAPHSLSGGEKQRVAIAAVLAMRPDVLALDEPTSLLDGRGRAEVLKLVGSLRSETLVHVTQFPDEIALAGRVIVLERGRVVFDGAPGALFGRRDELARWGLARPRTAAVADRLRSAGFDVPGDAWSLDALVRALSREGTGAGPA
ncbi:MAG: ATP-binding cassette domain-containing protein [Candidatus Eisenbacteria bacterium]|nr:ATP-binding cassette domain-containing protein [Candidatus Eisenbacteria bacterium]